MAKTTLSTRPLVSVVTPFYNTKLYLTQCIESVIAQSYSNFEYILMDNCSTDGSSEIAATFASRDPRIRLIRCSEFLPQLQNYNRALREISHTSTYCKIVQADDWIFPECLQSMIHTFEQSEAIGLVSAYWLERGERQPSDFPHVTTVLPGREFARWYLQFGIGIFDFGTPTQVMYRSSLVRQHQFFYNVEFEFADLQKHVEILDGWDFGFTPAVLSFTRRDNQTPSILMHLEAAFDPFALVRYVIARRYAQVFLKDREAAVLISKRKRDYYRFLAKAAFRLKGRPFWRYHKDRLNVLDQRETLNWPYLMLQSCAVLVWLIANPGRTVPRLLQHWKRGPKIEGLSKGKWTREAGPKEPVPCTKGPAS